MTSPASNDEQADSRRPPTPCSSPQRTTPRLPRPARRFQTPQPLLHSATLELTSSATITAQRWTPIPRHRIIPCSSSPIMALAESSTSTSSRQEPRSSNRNSIGILRLKAAPITVGPVVWPEHRWRGHIALSPSADQTAYPRPDRQLRRNVRGVRRLRRTCPGGDAARAVGDD